MISLEKIKNIIEDSFDNLIKEVVSEVPQTKSYKEIINNINYPSLKNFEKFVLNFFPKAPTDPINITINIEKKEGFLIDIKNGFGYYKSNPEKIAINKENIDQHEELISKLKNDIMNSKNNIVFYLKSSETKIPNSVINNIKKFFEDLSKKLYMARKDIFFSQEHYEFQNNCELFFATFGNEEFSDDLTLGVDIIRQIDKFIIYSYLREKNSGQPIIDYKTADIFIKKNIEKNHKILIDLKEFILSQDNLILETLKKLSN